VIEHVFCMYRKPNILPIVFVKENTAYNDRNRIQTGIGVRAKTVGRRPRLWK